MNENVIIANCGLVCSECGMYTKGKCKGCFGGKPMNSNCKIKQCTKEHQYSTCADCQQFSNLKQCGEINNCIGKFFGFIFRTDKIGNLNRIREIGYDKFKQERSVR